ncbi:hypothetical protein EJ05DRAFT_455870 [Pseudovirgaria hyperparasitica]|uniref:Uncharacterized protein n=1 Tax=Pseudovirgaria hyperparasitica TaxID=470096 RepID=A0A6A6W277_9PEZI|nr:uncharacterized protein EJ05DRAFT_455870 [Pseudovirgaria hyperparasitica]KAF2755121.1 hypothetical protein EJ05DRAFT_455870 [Pseudovirgaria hyperparasitica]
MGMYMYVTCVYMGMYVCTCTLVHCDYKQFSGFNPARRDARMQDRRGGGPSVAARLYWARYAA